MSNSKEKVAALRRQIDRKVKGYDHMKHTTILALLAGGHVLLRAVPGTAKTTFTKALAQGIDGANFSRIQCTPDLMASDIVGFVYFDKKTNEWRTKRGPILSTRDGRPVNFFLADEINRATPKTKAGLLEPMQEGQATIDDETLPLAQPFFMIATMNPIEQEGTYPLAEAEQDRFCVLVDMTYVSRQDEIDMLGDIDVIWPVEETVASGKSGEERLSIDDIVALRAQTRELAKKATDSLRAYIADVVRATRPGGDVTAEDRALKKSFDSVHGGSAPELREQIMVGASPRAEIWILRLAAANALVSGRQYITPDDVKAVAPDVLRHRVMISPYDQDATPDQVIARVLDAVPVVKKAAR